MAYSVYDTYTTDDGTKYVAMYSDNRTQIYKEGEEGGRTILSSSKRGGKRKAANRKKVGQEFDTFKAALEKAETGEQLSYSEEDITAGTGGFLKRDVASTLTLSDGTVLATAAGKTSNEIATLKRLADEVGAVSEANKPEETKQAVSTGTETESTGTGRLTGADEVVKEDIIEATKVDLGGGNGEGTEGTEVTEKAKEAEEALAEVGVASAAEFGGTKVGATTQNTGSFTNVASILSGGGMAGDAAGGQAEKEAAISVGPAEDEAIEMYTKGRRATIATSPRGLLSTDDEDEDPRLRTRRSLLAG